MTSRPSYQSKRPLSAVYLGSGSSPSTSSSSASNIPDLPEPPSPGGSSSSASGLPSPPATNSTGSVGSGSTGDNRKNAGSIRRPSSLDKFEGMLNGNNDNIRDVTWDASDEEDEQDHEAENAAKLHSRRRSSGVPSEEHRVTMQRVKSLTERNRLVLDKLSSISRTGSPSNHKRSPSSHSSLPPNSASTSTSVASTSSSSARHTSHLKSYSSPHSRHRGRRTSGSETERENHPPSLHSYPSSEELSTPPSSASAHVSSVVSSRRRGESDPISPDQLSFTSSSSSQNRNASPGPSSNSPRKRDSYTKYRDGAPSRQSDVASAALAAVAATRRSPNATSVLTPKKSRPNLPKEFTESQTMSLDGRMATLPTTPRRIRERSNTNTDTILEARGSPSPTSGASTFNTFNPLQSPRPMRASAGRSVRELSRRHVSRWASEDLTNTSHQIDAEGADSDINEQISPSGKLYGRRQSSRVVSDRVSSADIGRSVARERPRSMALSRREEVEDDVFRDDRNGHTRSSSVLARTVTNGGTRRLRDLEEERSEGSSRTLTRTNEGTRPSSRHRSAHDAQGPAPTERRVAQRSSYTGLSRPGTSMTAYSEDNPPQTAPALMRTYRSASVQPDLERTTTQRVPFSGDRAYSPSARYTSMSNAAPQADTQHARLLGEALAMFESNLSRLPPMGKTTTTTIPELFKNARSIAQTAERLSNGLRLGTSGALDRQIAADVSDDLPRQQLVALWKDVGAEFREHMRISDELVRTLTGFFLGAGKVLRETAHHHGKTISLDEDTPSRSSRTFSPEVETRGSDGGRSAGSRRSWEPPPTPRERTETMRPASGRVEVSRRPHSALTPGYESPTRNANGRRAITPREREQYMEETRDEISDLSSTTTRRHHRDPPPLSIPPPLTTIPSESLITRHISATEKAERRKASMPSGSTVRSPLFSALKTPSTTSSITPFHVSSSPDKIAFPLARNGSSGSGSNRANPVTFSRPSTISASALNGIHERDSRKRTISATSSLSEADDGYAEDVRHQLSMSETDREHGRRPMHSNPRATRSDAREGEHRSRAQEQLNASVPPPRRERRRTITELFG